MPKTGGKKGLRVSPNILQKQRATYVIMEIFRQYSLSSICDKDGGYVFYKLTPFRSGVWAIYSTLLSLYISCSFI